MQSKSDIWPFVNLVSVAGRGVILERMEEYKYWVNKHGLRDRHLILGRLKIS